MLHCSHPDCGWQAIAPSEEAARTQYADHLVDEHARTVEADIPEGMVQIRLHDDGEWITTTVEDAHDLHDAAHHDDT